jgi:hypothetical protein
MTRAKCGVVRLWLVIGVSEVVRQKAFAVGAVGWLEELPLLIASLERE